MAQHDVEAPVEQARRRFFATFRPAPLANEMGASDRHLHVLVDAFSCYAYAHAMSGSKQKLMSSGPSRYPKVDPLPE